MIFSLELQVMASPKRILKKTDIKKMSTDRWYKDGCQIPANANEDVKSL